MFKLYFFLFWVGFYLLRLFLLHKKTHPTILLVSFFISIIPLQMNFPIGSLLYKILAGSLGSQIYIYIPLVLFVCFIPFLHFKLSINLISKTNRWIWAFLCLYLISILNPYNESIGASTIALIFFLSNIIFFNLLYTNISKKNIISGLYDGMLILGIANFTLAICFPVLNLKFTTTLFHIAGEIGATRMGTASREGAIGFFGHPGNLALYSTISSVFFVNYIVTKTKTKLSIFIFCINFITIILTYSRTTYLVYIFTILIVYFILKNPKKVILSVSNIFQFIIPFAITFIWIVILSPFKDLFLESDISAQFDNRKLHWLMALAAFKQSPFIGVGINSHLIFFSQNLSILKNIELSPFFLENPIHNIHLIILLELGTVGLTLWILFLLKNLIASKSDISKGLNIEMSILQIGVIIIYFFYGMTGWAPFSVSILPYFLFIMYFTGKYRGSSNIVY